MRGFCVCCRKHQQIKSEVFAYERVDPYHSADGCIQGEDECPFCYLEREAEQHAISFALGSGVYMRSDVRAETDAMGFCRHHYKMMYDYGNRLGSGLILSTHLKN